MSSELWNAFLSGLHAEYEGRPAWLGSERGRFTDFVKQLPDGDRIPLLLHAYDRYRELGASCGGAGGFESSCYSILISVILGTKLQPSEEQAIAILRKSFHHCGHGSDVEPPLDLAERVFRNRPYSTELFDAVAAYRETLHPVRSTAANNIKRKLNWVLWHDPRHIEKNCWTKRIQRAIHAMEPPAALSWQWLLRNTAAGMNAAPGKVWLKDAGSRLSRIGETDFLIRLDEWFAFPSEEITLGPAGSNVLRLLVWYGSLVNTARSLPILARLAHVSWTKREPAQKVVSALAWLLHTHGGDGYKMEIEKICLEWSSDSSEVDRLQAEHFPAARAARQEATRAAAAERSGDTQQHLEKLLTAFLRLRTSEPQS